MSPHTRAAAALDWLSRAQCVAEAAIECCARCPVRTDCYDFGRATGSSGIFGGVSLAAGYDKANP